MPTRPVAVAAAFRKTPGPNLFPPPFPFPAEFRRAFAEEFAGTRPASVGESGATQSVLAFPRRPRDRLARPPLRLALCHHHALGEKVFAVIETTPRMDATIHPHTNWHSSCSWGQTRRRAENAPSPRVTVRSRRLPCPLSRRMQRCGAVNSVWSLQQVIVLFLRRGA